MNKKIKAAYSNYVCHEAYAKEFTELGTEAKEFAKHALRLVLGGAELSMAGLLKLLGHRIKQIL